MEFESMLFITNHILSYMYFIFEAFHILFPTASVIFTTAKLFQQVISNIPQNTMK